MLKNNHHLSALFLRLIGGGLMLTHGYLKLLKIINGEWGFADPIGIGAEATLILAVFTEVVCAIFILVGFKVKWAAIPLAITMLIAAFIVHGGDPMQKKESALIYLLVYLAIIWLGAGKYSIDGTLNKNKLS